MSKQLLVLRHGKSSWADQYSDDWERPLTDRGVRDAARVGGFLKRQSLLPDAIITSDAVRAFATAQGAAEAAGFSGKVLRASQLYHATPDAAIEVIRATAPADAERIMIVGHNPGLEELVMQLTGARVGLSTATLVHIELAIAAWNAIELSGDAVLLDSWHPDEL
jgi:phosphohistidine phosphatase